MSSLEALVLAVLAGLNTFSVLFSFNVHMIRGGDTDASILDGVKIVQI
jgi:hypothetical protein